MSHIKFTADFCISHGDEIKIIGVGFHVPVFDLNFAFMGPENVMQHHFRKATQEMIKQVHEKQESRELGENAHLVTHPHDR